MPVERPRRDHAQPTTRKDRHGGDGPCASRRAAIRRIAGVLAASALAPRVAGAQAPTLDRPVTLVVGAAPGGGVDRTARLLAPHLAEQFHAPVVVENRAGAGTRLAGDFVAKSAPDGRTLMFTTGESAIDLAFDPQARPNILEDLAPVSQVATCQMLLVVNSALPVHSVQELVARARATPGKLNYSTAGVKTTMHLVGELFTRQSGADIVHIPYKGTVPALAALLARDVDASFAGVPDSLPYVEAGKLRALAVAGSSRSPLVPNVPTMAEAGVDGVQAIIWYGILAPAGTPRDVVDALARAVNAASNAPQYRQSLAAMGIEPSPGTPAAFGALLRNDVAKYGAIIRDAHIHAE